MYCSLTWIALRLPKELYIVCKQTPTKTFKRVNTLDRNTHCPEILGGRGAGGEGRGGAGGQGGGGRDTLTNPVPRGLRASTIVGNSVIR